MLLKFCFASGDVWVSRLYRTARSGHGTAREVEFVGEAGPDTGRFPRTPWNRLPSRLRAGVFSTVTFGAFG